MARHYYLIGLLIATTANAAPVNIGWEYPLEFQPGAQYTLSVVSQAGSTVISRQGLLPTWTQQACVQHHQRGCPGNIGVTGNPQDCQLTEDTVCADVCLPIGTHTLTVRASGGSGGGASGVGGPGCVTAAQRAVCLCINQTCENAPNCVNCENEELTCTLPLCDGEGVLSGSSDSSNPLDIQVSVEAPGGNCSIVSVPPPVPRPPNPPPPPTPIPTPPSPPPPPPQQQAKDPWSLVNLNCVEWKILAPCYCNPYTACTLVEYWEPIYLVETVKRPGDTLMAPFVSFLLNFLPTNMLGGGGSGATWAGHTNIQYNEVHVWQFPQILGGPCSQGNSNTTLYYSSELDAPAWRTAFGVNGLLPPPPGSSGGIGTWSTFLYPRGGKSITGSEPVGSGISAVRGVDIAVNPVGIAAPPDVHVVLSKAPTNTRCCQLASPKQTACMAAGTNPATWEHGTVDKNGRYIWIFWGKKSCCTETTTSGITLLGGYGQNRCAIAPPSE